MREAGGFFFPTFSCAFKNDGGASCVAAARDFFFFQPFLNGRGIIGIARVSLLDIGECILIFSKIH